MDQLDGPAVQTSWTNQFFLFETLANLHISVCTCSQLPSPTKTLLFLRINVFQTSINWVKATISASWVVRWLRKCVQNKVKTKYHMVNVNYLFVIVLDLMKYSHLQKCKQFLYRRQILNCSTFSSKIIKIVI